MIGIFLGLLLGGIVGLIFHAFCVDFWKDRYAVPGAVICVIVAMFIGGFCEHETSARFIHSFEASKTTIEQSLENENLTGYERVALVEQAAEKNAELAEKQYSASRWYGFLWPDEVRELEPILLGGSE